MASEFETIRKRAERQRKATLTPSDPAGQAHGDFPHAFNPLAELDREAACGLRRLIVGIVCVFAIGAALLAACSLVFAHDDGRFAGSPLKQWFDGLASGKGLCCSFADGMKVENVDWDTVTGADGKVHYRLRVDGRWIVVPDAALVTEPNKFGPAVAWPYQDANGATQIRCFMPGAGS